MDTHSNQLYRAYFVSEYLVPGEISAKYLDDIIAIDIEYFNDISCQMS